MISENEINIRPESVKAAVAVASPHDGTADVLVHARWLAACIPTGSLPAQGRMAETTS